MSDLPPIKEIPNKKARTVEGDVEILEPDDSDSVPATFPINVQALHGSELICYVLDDDDLLYFPDFVDEDPEGTFNYTVTITAGHPLTVVAFIFGGVGSGSDSSDNVMLSGGGPARKSVAPPPGIKIKSCYRENLGSQEVIHVTCRKEPGAKNGKVCLLGMHKVWNGEEWALPHLVEILEPGVRKTVRFRNTLHMPYKVIAFLDDGTGQDVVDLPM